MHCRCWVTYKRIVLHVWRYTKTFFKQSEKHYVHDYVFDFQGNNDGRITVEVTGNAIEEPYQVYFYIPILTRRLRIYDFVFSPNPDVVDTIRILFTGCVNGREYEGLQLFHL